MQTATEHVQAGSTLTGRHPSTTPVPGFIRSISRDFGLRHVKGVAVTRALIATWLVILGSIFCAHGYWWGAAFFPVAGLLGWLAYQMPRWSLALKADQEVRAGR